LNYASDALFLFVFACSVVVAYLGVQLDAQWNDKSHTLTLQLQNNGSSKNGGGGSGSDNNGNSNGNSRRKGFGNGPSKGKQERGGQVEYGSWLAGLPSLSNPLGLRPVTLPLAVSGSWHGALFGVLWACFASTEPHLS